MLYQDSGRPTLSAGDVRRLVHRHYAIDARVGTLPSYQDQNFRLVDQAGREYIFKISHRSTSPAQVAAEHEAMARLAEARPAIPAPRVIATSGGASTCRVGHYDGEFLGRLLSFLPGVHLARVTSRSRRLLRNIGGFLGRVDRALAGYDHPATHRELDWDLVHAERTVGDHIAAIADPDRRARVEQVMAHFGSVAAPILGRLRQGVIHNDANDYNLLVGGDPDPDPGLIGILDFGDLVWSATVNDLAIVTAYAIMHQPEPLAAAAHVVAGYHEVMPLTEEELLVLFPLVRARLAVSVTMAAYQSQQRDDEYLTISEKPAWLALDTLAEIDPELAQITLRDACGLTPSPQSLVAVEWIKGPVRSYAPVLGPQIDLGNRVVFDLGPGSDLIDRPGDPVDAEVWTRKLTRILAAEGAALGIGRYDEPRLCYTGDQFLGESAAGRRTIHLGQDLFVPSGTPVHAPLAGTVHSWNDNDAPLDYGPTIILVHDPDPATGVEFFTLYGHLSRDSLDGLALGRRIAAGERIGRIGSHRENGGWPPHLHFQVITHLLGEKGNFPGVAPASARTLWTSICPDPGPLLGVSNAAGPAPGRSPAKITELRRRHAGPSLSLAYREPLSLVRGAGQYLYDHLGRPYLDCVNNVCHVGHCHPRVVAAAARQMAILNTNTRYLHDNLVSYLERLTALLPAPLSVCYLVCSGSEANELALRLARCHTGRRDVLVLDHAYHGNTGTMVDISPYKHAGPGGRGAPPWVHVAPLPDPYRGPHAGPKAGGRYARDLEELVADLVAHDQAPAAFIAESAPGCGGQVILPDGYLAQAFRTVRAAGGVAIADEVQVGFGRAGSHFWMFQAQGKGAGAGAVPDIVTLGKPIGNGHPLGAVVTTPQIAASFANGMEYFNTFGGNPVSCAVGLAVLDVIRDEDLQHRAATVGLRLRESLGNLGERHPMIGDVRGRGLFLGVEFVRDRATLEPATRAASYVVDRMKEEGVLLSTDGPFRNVLKIKPPLVFTEDDADRLVATLDRVLGEVIE